MSKKKDTVGKVASELMQKAPDTRDPVELAREMQEEYIDNLTKCVNENKKNYKSDFFVVVLTKNEKLLPNVYRDFFFARKTCPTPDYDQSIFRYNKAAEQLEYIWTIPSRDAAYHLKENALYVDKSERDLLRFVMDFSDGTLYKLCRKLNKEDVIEGKNG